MRPGEDQQTRYRDAVAQYGPAIERLARAVEADADERRDLVQDIHVALWRSLASFDGRRSPQGSATLEELELAAAGDDPKPSPASAQ